MSETERDTHPIDVACPACKALEETVCTFDQSTGQPIITIEDRRYHLARCERAKGVTSQRQRVKEHVERVLRIAGRIEEARKAGAISQLVTVTHENGDVETKTVIEMADPLILAAVIVADAINDSLPPRR